MNTETPWSASITDADGQVETTCFVESARDGKRFFEVHGINFAAAKDSPHGWTYSRNDCHVCGTALPPAGSGFAFCPTCDC